MNARIKEQLAGMAQAYWQHAVYALFGLILLIQASGLVYGYIELKQVDRLIAEAENVDASPEDEAMQPEEANNRRGGPPRGGQPGMNAPRMPEKDIFRKEEFEFMLTAIYLDTAYINGQEVKVGGRIGKATLTEIASFSVTLDVEGEDNPRYIEMFTGRGGGGGPPGGMRMSRRPSRSSRPPRSAEQAPSAPSGPPPGFGGPGGMMGRFRDMSPEERREAFQNLPPEMQERIQQFRGRGGRGGGGRD